MGTPALFLDRDGTLLRPMPGPIGSIAEAQVFPEALAALQLSKLFRGWKRVLVTNQAGVGRGVITLDQVRQVHTHLLQQVETTGVTLDTILMCPHTEEAQCTCRKPEPGMLLAAAEGLGIDLAQSWMIGDSWRDMWCGHAAGCRTILLTCGVELTEDAVAQADYVRANLYEACWLIGSITRGGR